MNSEEEESKQSFERSETDHVKARLNIPALKYFWQASPLATNKKKSIPKFLRSLRVFSHFTDYELKTFSRFIHERKLSPDEIIIKEGDSGFGFYIIFNGTVDIYTQKTRLVDQTTENYEHFVVRLSKYEYFGELSLLEKQNKRNASAIAKTNSTLLAIYVPDIEELIERYPVVGAKFLQAISLIVATRFNSVVEELQHMKEKYADLEGQIEHKED